MPDRPSKKMNVPDGLLAQLLDAIHECKQIKRDCKNTEAAATSPAPYSPTVTKSPPRPVPAATFELQVTKKPGSHLPPGWGE